MSGVLTDHFRKAKSNVKPTARPVAAGYMPKEIPTTAEKRNATTTAFLEIISTRLTFGTISSVYGLNAGFINQQQYSVLVGVVVASAVIPTLVAQKWFAPLHSEDIVNLENGNQ